MLPQANHKIQKRVSCLTGDLIRGAFIVLEDGISSISVNDAALWMKFNPFSPVMDGRFIEML